jgi:hypothetical protein
LSDRGACERLCVCEQHVCVCVVCAYATAGQEHLAKLTEILAKLVVPREVKSDWRGTDDEYIKLPLQDVMKSVWNGLILSINRWIARLDKCLQHFREDWPYRESDVISSGHFTALNRSATATIVEPSTGINERHRVRFLLLLLLLFLFSFPL